jgi:hypothetical protein
MSRSLTVQVGDKLWRTNKKTPLRVIDIFMADSRIVLNDGDRPHKVGMIRAITQSRYGEYQKLGKYKKVASLPDGGETYAVDDLVRCRGGWVVESPQMSLL